MMHLRSGLPSSWRTRTRSTFGLAGASVVRVGVWPRAKLPPASTTASAFRQFERNMSIIPLEIPNPHGPMNPARPLLRLVSAAPVVSDGANLRDGARRRLIWGGFDGAIRDGIGEGRWRLHAKPPAARSTHSPVSKSRTPSVVRWYRGRWR